jgi:hypothetical protein
VHLRRVFAPEDQLQPKYSTLNYAKPGDAITIGNRVFSTWPPSPRYRWMMLCSTIRSIWRLSGQADSSALLFYYNQRGHQVARVVALDAEDRQDPLGH